MAASAPPARAAPTVAARPKAALLPRSQPLADPAPESERAEAPEPGPEPAETVARPAEPDWPPPEPAVGRSRTDLPWLEALPAEFRARVPPFKINVYAYSKVPGERFAIIDMKKYLPGDRIPGGALLLEIRADGLVLELEGTKFRIPRP